MRLLTIATVLGALALLAGVLLGRRVTRPAEALTDAALRLGQGDFATSIPTGGPAEIGQLARTMDDMRRNLIELTGTLRKRDAESQAVLGGIVEGVYAVDRERRIRYLNPQAAKLLGIPAEEAIGRFCGDVLKPHCIDDELPCDTNCPILAARQRGQAEAVENLRTPAGDRRMVLISARPVDDLQVQVIRDETELEGVRRARDTVLANISHEFRTPLAAQLASIELLREGLATRAPEKNEELVISLERSTLRLTRLIDNLLESVRIESGQLDVRQQSLDLADVIEDATGLVDALAAAALAAHRARPAGRSFTQWRCAAPDAGVRQPAGQCQQVRARIHRHPRGRAPRCRQHHRLGGRRGPGPARRRAAVDVRTL